MRLDGFAILKSVADNVELFSDARDVVDKAALSILAAQLKAKMFDLDCLKQTCSALGIETLTLVLQHFPDSVPKTLVSKIDPHHAKVATDNVNWMRSHIVALASGEATPEPKPASETKKPSKGKKKPKSEQDILAESFWSTSVVATPRRSSKTTGKSK